MYKKKNRSGRNLGELLDSDDELPNEYYEIPEIPAYQNDNRFDIETLHDSICSSTDDEEEEKKNEIEFSIYSTSSVEQISKPEEFHNINEKKEKLVIKKTLEERQEKNTLISKGVLRKPDVYCLKSIAPKLSIETMIWLINFLLYKDLQSDYQFLNSCLVIDNNINTMDNSKQNIRNYYDEKRTHFNIVIKRT